MFRSASTSWLLSLLLVVGCGNGTAASTKGSAASGSSSGSSSSGVPGSSGSSGSPASAGAISSAGGASGGSASAGSGPGSTGTSGSAAGSGGTSLEGGAGDAAGTGPATGKQGTLTFTRKTLHTLNLAEAIAFADYNKDGHVDVLSGPYWWEGPAFDVQHQLFPPPPSNSYTGMTLGDWADYAYDVDGDGWIDSINVMRPGTPSYWYKNPGMPMVAATVSAWAKSEIGTLIYEQSAFADISGDGIPDLVGSAPGTLGWFDVGTTSPWKFHAISPQNAGSVNYAFWHGIGTGDLFGDGKVEFLEANGWWTPPAAGPASGLWLQHPMAFKNAGLPPQLGPSQMFAYDVNGDGQTDVVSALDAHGYGVAWFEQNKGAFIQHDIVGPPGAKNAGGIASFSQPHALYLTDVDGDGLKDIITGKSFYAHPPGAGDPDAAGTPVFYVFKLIRGAQGVSWEPHLVDSVEGLGRQVTATDLNGDGLVDIAVAGKHGVFLFFQQ